MAKLTKEQKAFFAKHNIGLDKVLDAGGNKPSIYEPLMKEHGFLAAIGVTPCRKYGHQIRGSNGHCLACSPANIAFVKRATAPGIVYLAYSEYLDLVKIGTAKSTISRITTLNKQAYAGSNDWTLKAHMEVSNAGSVELIIHDKLKKHQEYREFIKNGSTVLAQEIFSCSVNHAIKTMKQIASKIPS